MPISLDKFSEPEVVFIPIINGKGVYRRRKFSTYIKDGFYYCRLGDKVEVLNEVYAEPIQIEQMMTKLPAFRGIAYGNSIIPLNFSNAKFMGYGEVVSVNFMNAELGMVVIARRWEDGNLLFHQIDNGSKYQMMCVGVKDHAEKGEPLDHIKGITPEMRYFYVMVVLDRQRFIEWQALQELEISRKEKEKRLKAFRASFAGRLKVAVESAGGALIKFIEQGDNIALTWAIGDEIFKSTIKQDFKVMELGFCASGRDKDHSISSAVALAKDFMRDGLIYKTRTT